MKTNTILVSLYSPSLNARTMETLCGHYRTEFDTKQIAEYTITAGIATITALTPTMKTQVALPLPFILPATDLGSGLLQRIDINIDTLTAQPAICPTAAWAERRSQQPAPTIHQTLMADYIGLL